VAYNNHEADQDEDGQQMTERFHLPVDSSDEYQNSNIFYQTELDTEPDTDENDNPDGTSSITPHQSRAEEKQTNNMVSTAHFDKLCIAGSRNHQLYPSCTSTYNTK